MNIIQKQPIPIIFILLLPGCKLGCKLSCKLGCKLGEIVQNADNFTLYLQRRYRELNFSYLF